MDEEKKKNLYGGSYDDAIRDTYNQIQNRGTFNYDVNGDALYQQYKDRYTQNAKNAMKDTLGQAAALTGGYGSSYAQGVGQQRYDETMRGLTDMIPQLEQNAYARWQDQGNALQDRYNMLMNLGATEQQTRQNNYANLYSMIGATGYMPTAEELAAAGMTEDAAKALQNTWAASNPQQAYNNGIITADQYHQLTGAWPVGYQAPGSGGYGYYGGGSGSTKEEEAAGGNNPADMVSRLRAAGATAADIMRFLQLNGLVQPGQSNQSKPGTTWVRTTK